MRRLIYVLLLSVTLVAPVRRVDVGTLQPVEILSVSKEQGGIAIRTDTDDLGVGNTVEDAVKDLKQTALGVIYLDTVDFLLLEENCQAEAFELAKKLDRSVRVCYVRGDPSLKTAKEFVRAHGAFPSISEWIRGRELPILQNKKY